ncbi:MAG TPA: T9SS type A sorting domain-containing protein [Flavobacteriales bacterium]|nr:T9SS type A sorting domain-containing protein [Flavobacteriales bacterium]HMR28252.1 T9SS type A sorting domain-containing protein [Flavobacteriales bacterium]
MKKAVLFSTFAALASFQSVAQCPPGETQVTMTIVTDAYGSETTWEVTGPGGSPVYGSGGPYQDQSGAGEYPQTPVSFCVPDGTVLTITVEDSYGDGMCCLYGDGSWTISVGGTDVATGGSFGSSQSANVVLGTDLGISTLGVPVVIAQGNTTITGTVTNAGITAISGFTLDYAVDGGAPVSQNFSATVQPGSSYTYTFTTPWNATVGSHTIELTLSGVNGDLFAGNNTLSSNVGVATQSVQRTVLVEEFTSSTCPPCASYNTTFDPLLGSLNTNDAGSNYAAIKYQMNWPSPGNDPSYNPDGNARKSYYGVTGIPDVFLDGRAEANGFINNSGNLATEASKPAFVNVDITYALTGFDLTANVTVNSYADFAGTYKLHIAATEDFYTFSGNTTGQDEYHYAQRKMMPNAQGTTVNLTAGGTETISHTYTFTEGGPAQGNYNLWGTLDGVTLVAFVQNSTTKEILQADFVNVVATGVEENVLDNSLRVFPNPSNGVVNVAFDLPSGQQASLEVTNVLGEVVYTTSRSIGAGAQREVVDLSTLTNGVYYMTITAGDLKSTRKVTLNK